jgi:Glycosyltransferase family 87
MLLMCAGRLVGRDRRSRAGAGLLNVASAGENRLRLLITAVRAVFFGFAAVSVAFYIVRFWTVYAAGELFHRLGYDWSLFYAQAMVLRSRGGPQMYDLAEMDRQLQALLPFYLGSSPFQSAMQVPYPPWFAAVIEPFTVPPAPIGFGLWLGISVLCGVFLAYRVAQFLPNLRLPGAALLVFAAFPVAWGLFMGQMGLVLALAVGEMFISFKAGRDLRAGLWLSVLFLKPQYAFVFGLLILWKWRVRAIVGCAIGICALVVLGIVAAGGPALLRFPLVLGEMAEFRNPIASPWRMINWRAFVLYGMPGLEDEQGVVVVGILSALTILLLLYYWRDPWDPTAPGFAPRFAAIAFGVLVTSYHSHLHGAPLVIVPLAAAWGQSALGFRTRCAMLAALYVPTVMIVWTGGVLQRFAVSTDTDVPLWTVWPDELPSLLFITAFVLICRDVWRMQTQPAYECS